VQTIRGSIRRRIVVIYSCLIAFSAAVRAWALMALSGLPKLILDGEKPVTVYRLRRFDEIQGRAPAVGL
jgi:hypothetical protein